MFLWAGCVIFCSADLYVARGLFRGVLQLSYTEGRNILIPSPTLDFSHHLKYPRKSSFFLWNIYTLGKEV